MNWHYYDGEKQVGPVSEEQLLSLHRTGQINNESLVWREGLAEWVSFGSAGISGARTGVGGEEASNQAVCAECGGIFNVEDMIPHGNIRICANCKPVFMQKLAEGARINTGQLQYASILTRFGAVFLDNLLLWIVNFFIAFALGLSAAQAAGVDQTAAMTIQIGLTLVQITIGVLYEALMIGKYGATLGKMACKIKVVTAEGGKVGYGRAFGRYFAKILSAFICMIGYIMAFFDKEEKRALHDRICNTRVVMK